jgi:hypothetical protein
MGSGTRITQEQVDAILRLAGEKNADDDWALTYEQIAERVSVHPRTIYRVVRQAAVRWGQLTAWMPGDYPARA